MRGRAEAAADGIPHGAAKQGRNDTRAFDQPTSHGGEELECTG